MSSKHKRHRSVLHRENNRVPKRATQRNTGSRRILAIVAVAALAGVCLFGFSLLKKSSTGDFEPAIENHDNSSPLASAQKQPPGSTRKDEAFASQVNRGSELLKEGKPAEAVEALTEALKMNAEDEDVHYNLGLALARLGKVDEALKHYEEALRIFPDYAEAHNNLGNLLMRMGRADEAISHLERAVKIMPDYASAHNNLGTALQKAGRLQEAVRHFQEAVKINPDYWQAHFNIGMSFLQLGDTSAARKEFEVVLHQQPDFKPAKAALAEIEAQQSGPAPPKP